jgi:hypothetical protein
MKILGTANLLEMRRCLNEAETMKIIPDHEIPIHVVCDDNPLNREWYDIIGMENSGDSLCIRVTKHRPLKHNA